MKIDNVRRHTASPESFIFGKKQKMILLLCNSKCIPEGNPQGFDFDCQNILMIGKTEMEPYKFKKIKF